MNTTISLPLTVAAIVGYGLWILSSAVPTPYFLNQQLIYLALAAGLCTILWFVGAQRLLKLAGWAYAAGLVLLVVTMILGVETYGAKSRLVVGSLPTFQPSEFMKLALILMLAAVLHHRTVQKLSDYAVMSVFLGLPFALVFLEPDLGGALVLLATGMGMMLVRGLPTKHLVAAGLLLVLAFPTVVWPNLAPHQKERVQVFMNPAADPQGAGYQIIQARIGIGSGGLLGKGYQQGTQAQLGFIPFRHTDFIFAVLAEEAGFVGSVVLLALYGLLFWQLMLMASECGRRRDALVIVGVLVMIGFQFIVNVGVTIGLAPVTGITLPLVSYGGTSLIMTLVSLMVAYVVHRDRFLEW